MLQFLAQAATCLLLFKRAINSPVHKLLYKHTETQLNAEKRRDPEEQFSR